MRRKAETWNSSRTNSCQQFSRLRNTGVPPATGIWTFPAISPEGRIENSPAVHCWVRVRDCTSPEGTAESVHVIRQFVFSLCVQHKRSAALPDGATSGQTLAISGWHRPRTPDESRDYWRRGRPCSSTPVPASDHVDSQSHATDQGRLLEMGA